MKSIKDSIDLNNLPQHIAVIMDGNGRWAKRQGKERLYGHLNGVESVRAITEAATEIGVKYLTLYTFSTENWNRPKEEIDGLMELLVENIVRETPTFHKNNIRLRTIGDNSMLPIRAQEKLNEAMADTAKNDGLNLVLALSYSSRWEITNATKLIAQKVKEGIIDPAQIDAEMISNHLTTNEIPDPDLLIRTSGELRLSNYLLWQLAYSELYFTETLWPDFRNEEFFTAIYEYQHRERRYGKTSEQL